MLHTDTPQKSELLTLFEPHSVQTFTRFSDLKAHTGIAVVGFAQLAETPRQWLGRVLMVARGSEAKLLYDGQWLKKGLSDAIILPYNRHFLRAKVDQLVQRSRDFSIGDLIEQIQNLTEGSLSPKEVGIVVALLKGRNGGVSRKEFAACVWPGVSVHTKTLDTHLFNLRSKLERVCLKIVWHKDDQVWRLRSDNPDIHLG